MDRIGSYLTYFYLLRIPILSWLLLVLLPVLSVPRRAPLGSILRGAFDLSGGGIGQLALSFLLLSFVSFMAAVAVALTARLVMLDGEARFSAGPIPAREPGVKLSFRLCALLTPLPLISMTLIETYYGNDLGTCEILAGICGIAGGIGAFFFTMTKFDDWLWDLAFVRNDLRKADMWEEATSPDDEGDGATTNSKYKPNWFLDSMARGLVAAITSAQRIVALSPEGYFVPATCKFYNRHVFALLHLILSLGLYVGLYFTKYNRVAGFTPPRIPTLCLLLALIMFGCFALSGLSFFFDRFRIPLLSLIALYALLSSQFPQTDHFFKSRELSRDISTSSSLVHPASRCSNQKNSPVILVAASGGGIQSAAWTAIVLSGLKQDLQQEAVNFDCSIKVISSVSGGSVGAMYFADAYDDGALPPVDGDLRNYPPVKEAEASSLDALAWGLAYPDLGWAIAPFLKGIGFNPLTPVNGENLTNDRGTALENAWRMTPGLTQATVSGWRQDSALNNRPALIFNSTIVETGERFLISTTDLESTQQVPSANGRKLFSRLYSHRDLDIVTAARLSATFPYATPAARIWERDAFAKSYHIADGAYYDNYGIISLLDWLDFRAGEGAPYPPKVIIVQIRGFRTQSFSLPSQHQGALFEFLQPLETLLHVRDTGQFSHNEVDMSFARRPQAYPFPVYSVDFEFDAADEAGDAVEPPLSWHLSFVDKYFLHHYWSSKAIQDKRKEFKTLFITP